MSADLKTVRLMTSILVFASGFSAARAAVPASIPLPIGNPSFEDGNFVDSGGGYENLAQAQRILPTGPSSLIPFHGAMFRTPIALAHRMGIISSTSPAPVQVFPAESPRT